MRRGGGSGWGSRATLLARRFTPSWLRRSQSPAQRHDSSPHPAPPRLRPRRAALRTCHGASVSAPAPLRGRGRPADHANLQTFSRLEGRGVVTPRRVRPDRSTSRARASRASTSPTCTSGSLPAPPPRPPLELALALPTCRRQDSWSFRGGSFRGAVRPLRRKRLCRRGAAPTGRAARAAGRLLCQGAPARRGPFGRRVVAVHLQGRATRGAPARERAGWRAPHPFRRRCRARTCAAATSAARSVTVPPPPPRPSRPSRPHSTGGGRLAHSGTPPRKRSGARGRGEPRGVGAGAKSGQMPVREPEMGCEGRGQKRTKLTFGVRGQGPSSTAQTYQAPTSATAKPRESPPQARAPAAFDCFLTSAGRRRRAAAPRC
jgi:hypothetical protein